MSNLLITGCGGNHFLETLPCYKPNRIVGVASELDEFLYPLLDGYVKVSRCNSPEYIKELVDVCRRYKIDILIPTLDAEMESIVSNLHMFHKIGVKVSVSNPSTIETLTDKAKFNEFLKINQLPYAKYRIIHCEEMLEKAASEIGYPYEPICMKMTNRGGSRGFRVIYDNCDFFDDYANKKPSSRFITMDMAHRILKNSDTKILLQEYLGGEEYSTDMVCDNGKVLAIAGRRNIVVDNSIPIESVVDKDKEAYDISETIAKKLCLDGNIGIDFIRNKDGQAIPVEANARVTATVGLFAKAGLNLPMIQVQRLLGEKIEIPEIKYQVRMKKRYAAYYEGDVDNG
jgi:carbamoyl-phosphate synthase large subunit